MDDFYAWLNLKHNTNKGFKVISELVSTYGFISLFMFRCAVRRNNNTALISARRKFAPMFYLTYAPNYCNLEKNDVNLRMSAPVPINNFISTHESHSRSGHHSKHEGYDYVLVRSL